MSEDHNVKASAPDPEGKITFHPFVRFEERVRLAMLLKPLAAAGFRIDVQPPDITPNFAWDILVQVPGENRPYRIQKDATEAEWAILVRKVLQGPKRIAD